MRVEEIKAAVDAGKTVHWSSSGYTVIRDRNDEYLIGWNAGTPGASYIGLTHRDGTTLNGKPGEFYIAH